MNIYPHLHPPSAVRNTACLCALWSISVLNNSFSWNSSNNREKIASEGSSLPNTCKALDYICYYLKDRAKSSYPSTMTAKWGKACYGRSVTIAHKRKTMAFADTTQTATPPARAKGINPKERFWPLKLSLQAVSLWELHKPRDAPPGCLFTKLKPISYVTILKNIAAWKKKFFLTQSWEKRNLLGRRDIRFDTY